MGHSWVPASSMSGLDQRIPRVISSSKLSVTEMAQHHSSCNQAVWFLAQNLGKMKVGLVWCSHTFSIVRKPDANFKPKRTKAVLALDPKATPTCEEFRGAPASPTQILVWQYWISSAGRVQGSMESCSYPRILAMA